jgi:hypothetical protein
MTQTVSRLLSTGVLQSNVTFDETTYNSVKVSPTGVFAAEFDEVNLSASTAERRTSTGTYQVSGYFDEVTGAPVVDSSLVLWLDALQTSSYSGSGTTWTDLSSNSNNGALTNSPAFDSINGGGAIGFSGSNQYVSIPNTTSVQPAKITVCVWVKFNSFNSNTGVIVQPQSSFPGTSWIIRVTGSGTGYEVGVGSASAVFRNNSFYSFNTNTWYFLTLTYDGANMYGYVNAGFTGFSGANITINYTATPIQIASTNTAGEYLNGYVSNAMIYNRALSTDEISQNFNALRKRFGV